MTMPPKSRNLKQTKPVAKDVKQRTNILTLFQNAKAGKAVKKNSTRAQLARTDNDVILVLDSDDEDDFVPSNIQKTKTCSAGGMKLNAESSASKLHDLSKAQESHVRKLSFTESNKSNGCIMSHRPRTPPTPVEKIVKKMKSSIETESSEGEITENLHGSVGVKTYKVQLFSPLKSESRQPKDEGSVHCSPFPPSPPSSIPETSSRLREFSTSSLKLNLNSQKVQNQPKTPERTPVIKKASSTTKKRWENSPFRKFPIRKAKSAPGKLEFSQRADPYYLANFKFIVNSIFYDDFFKYLFNEEDREVFSTFRELDRGAKMLYIRLFQRKVRWLPGNAIKYNEIQDDLSPILEKLTAVKFLQGPENLNDLEEVLMLLPAPNLKDLAKKFHVTVDSQTKEDIVARMKAISRRPNISSLFGKKSSDLLEKKMIEGAKTTLGRCFRISPAPRALFNRCLALLSLSSTAFDEDDQTQAQQYIFTLLQINRGALEYPDYRENRTTRIYRDRESLIEFQSALSVDGEIMALMDKQNYEKAESVYITALQWYEEYLIQESRVGYDLSLPPFLQPFTAGSVHVRILNHGVEILQKRRRYKHANQLLEKLLAQPLCTKYRGHWYDRLALNLESHLKSHAEALDVIGRGLADDRVRAGRRLALYQRAERICRSPSHKALKHRLKEFQHQPLQQIPSITIEAQKLSTSFGKTSKSSFIHRKASATGAHDEVTLCSVEEVALKHYKELGYDQGVHGEGSTLMTLMMIYIWEIAFSDIPDVFYNHYQTAPLDLYTDEFYTSRKDRIDGLLEWMEGAPVEELTDKLEMSWNRNHDVVCHGCHWTRFSDLDNAKSLVRCLGGRFLSAVFRRHVTDMRHCRSGVPDLMVWNTTNYTYRIVEVKGPGDRLSTKQQLWLDYYLKLGANAEVCHVRGVSGKMLKHKSPSNDQVDHPSQTEEDN